MVVSASSQETLGLHRSNSWVPMRRVIMMGIPPKLGVVVFFWWDLGERLYIFWKSLRLLRT